MFVEQPLVKPVGLTNIIFQATIDDKAGLGQQCLAKKGLTLEGMKQHGNGFVTNRITIEITDNVPIIRS